MTIYHLLISALLSAGLLGCGGNSQNLDTSTAPPTVQRMLAGGAPHVVQADAAATTAVSISGYRDNYTIAKNQTTNIVTVASTIDNSVTTYQNPSLIKFVDKWTSFDIDGAAGQVYRLYQAAFNRTPDLPGLGFWIAANQNGRDVLGIASDFVVSAEFKTLYGESPANLKLINAFYNNVLHRDGEKEGVNWWTAQMDAGAAKSGVLYGFSDSAENKANLQNAMVNGFDYVPFNQGGPIIPKSSSYENKTAAMSALGPVALPNFNNGEIVGAGYAFADFDHNGSYSMVVNTGNYASDSAPNGYPKLPGKIHFYSKLNGDWVETTRSLISDNTGCITPRKMLVADFNGDGRPDVFIACHGIDAAPFPGEHPRFLMSAADGTYKNVVADFTCFCHGAAAANVSHNGYADLVVVDTMIAKTPYYLINNKNGTFTQDFSRMPASVAPFSYPGQTALFGKQIYSVELIDFDHRGLYDLFVGAAEPNSFMQPVKSDAPEYYVSSLYKNDGGNRFSDARRLVMPNLDKNYGLPLDVSFDHEKIYILRVIDDPENPLGFYSGLAVEEVAYPSLESRMVYRHTGSYNPASDGQSWKWFAWFGVYAGKIRSMDAAYDVEIDF
jgi:hypothetical protein